MNIRPNLFLQDTVIICETARLYDEDLYKQFMKESEVLDSLGRSGCNLYNCYNYAINIPCDDDALPGFCVQLDLTAHKPYKEYAFVYAEYGVYFETRSNMLW